MSSSITAGLLPSLALNFEVMYSSPGSLFFFLLADALGQPERLRGGVDQNQNHRNQMHQISRCHLVHVVLYWWCCWLSVKPSSSHHQVTETHIHSIKL